MKSTAETVKEMEWVFDEKFPGDIATMEEDGIHARIISSAYNRDRLKDFILVYSRTLLEAFGKEVIGEDEDISIGVKKGEPAWDAKIDEKYAMHKLSENTLKAKQRLKVKEILQNIK